MEVKKTVKVKRRAEEDARRFGSLLKREKNEIIHKRSIIYVGYEK